MKHKLEFFGYIALKADELRSSGKVSTAANYIKFSNSLHRFLGAGRTTLPFREITENFTYAYEQHLKERGLKPSSVSLFNRVFRSIYNKAVREGLVKNTHPFDESYTKVICQKRARMVDVNGRMERLEDLSKPEILNQYRILAERHNNLLRSISKIVY